MSELKPCPFCGGEAKVFFTEESGMWDVQCQKCGAMPFVHKQEESAIAAWNSRTERTCKIVSSYLNDFTSKHMCWYEFEMQCGFMFTWDEMEPPNYCPNCGARVIA